jgi:hypothetical protein
LEPQWVYFTAAIKRFVLNGTKCTDGCFIATLFQTQHASFSGRCSGRSAVGVGNGTQKNIPACGHERQDNRTSTSLRLPFQASAQIMDLDFTIFYNERLITEVENQN